MWLILEIPYVHLAMVTKSNRDKLETPFVTLVTLWVKPLI
mgnify:CR=1 FL=1